MGREMREEKGKENRKEKVRLENLHPLQEAEAIERNREDWMKMAHATPRSSLPFHKRGL